LPTSLSAHRARPRRETSAVRERDTVTGLSASTVVAEPPRSAPCKHGSTRGARGAGGGGGTYTDRVARCGRAVPAASAAWRASSFSRSSITSSYTSLAQPPARP